MPVNQDRVTEHGREGNQVESRRFCNQVESRRFCSTECTRQGSGAKVRPRRKSGKWSERERVGKVRGRVRWARDPGQEEAAAGRGGADPALVSTLVPARIREGARHHLARRRFLPTPTPETLSPCSIRQAHLLSPGWCGLSLSESRLATHGLARLWSIAHTLASRPDLGYLGRPTPPALPGSRGASSRPLESLGRETGGHGVPAAQGQIEHPPPAPCAAHAPPCRSAPRGAAPGGAASRRGLATLSCHLLPVRAGRSSREARAIQHRWSSVIPHTRYQHCAGNYQRCAGEPAALWLCGGAVWRSRVGGSRVGEAATVSGGLALEHWRSPPCRPVRRGGVRQSPTPTKQSARHTLDSQTVAWESACIKSAWRWNAGMGKTGRGQGG